MRLTFVRETVLSGDTNCPSLCHPDRGTFVVRGWRVTDEEALASLDVPAGETVVEVPVDVLAEVAGRIPLTGPVPAGMVAPPWVPAGRAPVGGRGGSAR